MSRFKNIYLIVFSLFFSLNVFALEDYEKILIKAIKAGDVAYVTEWISLVQDVDADFSNSYNALYYAVKYNQPEIAYILLSNGSDPNKEINGKSSLFYAIKYNEWRMTRLLIEFGADLNYQDAKGRTPLMYAAKYNRLDITKILVDRGGNPFDQCKRERTPADYAFQADGKYVLGYLESVQKQIENNDSVIYGIDGPHFIWEGPREMVMTYNIVDRSIGRTYKREKTFYIDDSVTSIKGIEEDGTTYQIRKKYEASPVENSTEGGIFAFGDVHGEYERMLELLKNNQIIDENNDWNFGEGHLIFLGDVFDRGSKVTETLLFIYNLEQQARHNGGDVHLLIGNHETMALNGDNRYLHPKYTYFARYFYTPYEKLYAGNTVIGDWLRKQNAVVAINDYVFLHAGFSPSVLRNQVSMDKINDVIRTYLKDPSSVYADSIGKLVISQEGPLWYRGYSSWSNLRTQVNKSFIDELFDYYGFTKMIIGHNENKDILVKFDDRVYSIDVPLDREGINPQALKIEGTTFYKCLLDGEMIPLNK